MQLYFGAQYITFSVGVAIRDGFKRRWRFGKTPS